jgi:hypothetical protein
MVDDELVDAWKLYFEKKFPGLHVITFASFQSSHVKL